MEGWAMAADRPRLTIETFISGALEADPATYADEWAADLERELLQEVQQGGEGFFASILRALEEEAQDRGKVIKGFAATLYRTGRERAAAALHAVLGVMNTAAQRRPNISRFLAALVERFRDLMRVLANKLGATGFSIGIGGFPVSVSLSLNYDAK
jgi:hypothetical protein